MLKAIILLSLFGFSVCTLADESNYDDWKKSYEKGECKAVTGDAWHNDMDLVLQCAPSPTVENLRVTAEAVDYSGEKISAQVSIENSNPYPVHIKFLTVDGLDDLQNTVGYCSERVSFPMLSGDKVTTRMSCTLQILPSSDGATHQPLTNIQGFKFVAAPQF